MSKKKNVFSYLLLSCALASGGTGAFLSQLPKTAQNIVAQAEIQSYQKITNSKPDYLSLDKNDVSEKDDVFLFSNLSTDLISFNIAKNSVDGKTSNEKAVKNFGFFPDEKDLITFYYFKFSNTISLVHDLTNEQIENGETGENLLTGKPISSFISTFSASGEDEANAGIPKGLTFTPEKLSINFKLGNAFEIDGQTIILDKEGCYTLSIPVVVYRTTDGGKTYISSEEVVNYTFMAFNFQTYFNQISHFPNITSSNNVQDTTIQGASQYSKYYFHSYSSTESDEGNNLPSLTFNPNLYQFKVTYTDTDQNIKTSIIEYSNGSFVQYDVGGVEIESQDYFVWAYEKNSTSASLVFNNLGTYDIDISYLYKTSSNENEQTFLLPFDKFEEETFKNKKQKLFIYGYQALYSDYQDIDTLTNQPVSKELKTLDTQLGKYSLSADITTLVNKEMGSTVSNPNSTDALNTDNLKTATLSAINNLSPVSTNQTPVKFLTNANVASENSRLYTLSKNGENWEATEKDFSLLNQNTAGVYLYIIQYKYPQFMSQTGSLLPDNYHYQVFFFEVTNIAPSVSLYERIESQDENQTEIEANELYTRGYTNKSVYIIDNAKKNPYDAKVSITLTAYDYITGRNLFTNVPIENFDGSNSSFNIKYQAFSNTHENIDGKSGLFISNTSSYCNAKYTIKVLSANATTPSVTTFTIDTTPIENISARRVSVGSGSNFKIGESISQTSSNQPLIFSWNEKASNVPTYGYLKYIKLEDNSYYNESSISPLLQTLLEDYNTLPINYSFDLSSLASDEQWFEYSNTQGYDDVINSSFVRQNNGFYILEVFDGAGNTNFEIFLIDKTSPLFVKNQYDKELEIAMRSLISNSENIDVPEDPNYDISIEWAKYKGIILKEFDNINTPKSYAFSKDVEKANETFKAKLKNFFGSNSCSYLSGSYVTSGYYYQIETSQTYYTLDNNQYVSNNGYNYSVSLYKYDANGNLIANESSHSILLRDASNTQNYIDEATSYKNAPSGMLNFRVTSDASKLDIKEGTKPADGNWTSLQWSNYAFSGNLDTSDKPIGSTNGSDTEQTPSEYKYKYSYVLPTNTTNKLSLTYVAQPENGAIVKQITLKYYPYEKKETTNGSNHYFYYALAENQSKSYVVYDASSISVETGKEYVFEIALGSNDYPIAGKYVFERTYDKSQGNIGKFDYLSRTISLIVDPYNVISEIESVSKTEDDTTSTSLESLVGGDILISMYSREYQNNIEISFPRYVNGLNQGSFYTESSFKEDEFNLGSISVSGNKLPLSLLIPQFKYTISSIKDTNNSYTVTNETSLTSFSNAKIEQMAGETNFAVILEGIRYADFTTREEAEEFIKTSFIKEYELYAKIEFTPSTLDGNKQGAKEYYHGGNLASLPNNGISANGYMNFYKETSNGFETTPTTEFSKPGTYVVTLYQANNLGKTFDNLYSFYKFGFEIEDVAPSFNIINSSGLSLEEVYKQGQVGVYHTNSENLEIEWEIPKSDYFAKIDEDNINISLNGQTIVIDKETIDETNSTKSFKIDASSVMDKALRGENPYLDITMQFEGHDDSLYGKTTKRVYFDVTSPSQNLLSLMRNVENSTKLFGTSSLLPLSSQHELSREYYDYTGTQLSNISESNMMSVSYSYAKSTGALKYYYYQVSTQFIDTTLKEYLISSGTFDTKEIYYKKIEDLSSYTQTDKDSFNANSYSELATDAQNDTAEGIYEIVERDYAGNMTIYLVNMTSSNENDAVLSYTNAKSTEDEEFTFTYKDMANNENNLYSNRGFNITGVYYGKDEWELFSVIKNDGTRSVYMLSPWLEKGQTYKVSGKNFETTSLSQIFENAEISSLKHQIMFADRLSGGNARIYITIYNANLITSTSYDSENNQTILSIQVPSKESLNSTTYGYVFPVKVTVSLFEDGEYREIGSAETHNGLYGTWETTTIGTSTNAINSSVQNNTFSLRTTISSQSTKLKYEITDNFGNKTSIVQLANGIVYNEVEGSGIIYQVTESDNSQTYISNQDITFSYDKLLYRVVVNDGERSDYTTDEKNGLTALNFSAKNKYYKIDIYDSADNINSTPLRVVYIKIYDKLPSFTADRNQVSSSSGNIVFLDKNLNAFTEKQLQTKKLNKSFDINGRTFETPTVSYISTYSSAVTFEYKNSSTSSNDHYYLSEFPYSAYLSRDGGETFVRLDRQDGTISKEILRGAGDYIIVFMYDDNEILSSNYKAYMVSIWNSESSYYTITIDGEKVERSKLTYTSPDNVTYEVNYLVGIDYSNKNRVVITPNGELDVTLSSPILQPSTGTDVYVEVYNYSCEESSGSFALVYIKPSNDFVSLLSYEPPSGGSETILGKTSETIVAKETDTSYDKLKITYSSYYGIKSNKLILKVEKMFDGNFVDVTPEANYQDSYATSYITRAGYYRISIYDSCIPANVQNFKGNPYTYIYFLNSVPFVVSTTDEQGNKLTSEGIQNAVYNSPVTIALTNLSAYYNPSKYPEITVYRNGQLYSKATNNSNGYAERNYQYTFSEPGFYQVEFSAKSTKEIQIRNAPFYFTIINKNESRDAYEFTKYESYYIKKIVKEGIGDVTEDFIKFGNFQTTEIDGKTYLTALSLSYLDQKTGSGRYTITICPNNASYENAGVKDFTFTCWINKAIPPIEVSIKEGTSTTSDITIKFNVSNFYNAVGDCYIKIGSMVKYYNAQTIASLGETETLTITQDGTHYIQVFTESGQLVYSYKVIKNEPLNAFAIIAIVCGVIAVGVVVGITIKLRKRQKAK